MRFFEASSMAGPLVYTRVNVVMHGLLAFWVIDPEYYDILVPRSGDGCTPHLAEYGNPLTGIHRFPVDSHFPAPTRFHLSGVIGATASQECRPSASNALLLQSSKIDLLYENILVMVRVPKPNMIRHYRGAETRGIDLTGGHAPTQGCLVRPPDVVHDITVFSYNSFHRPKLEGRDVDYPIHRNYSTNAGNLHIYCQPLKGCTGADKDIFSPMFHIKSVGSSPQIDLSLETLTDDGPPTTSAIGLEPMEWATLAQYEALLKEAEAKQVSIDQLPKPIVLAAAPGGCGGAFGS